MITLLRMMMTVSVLRLALKLAPGAAKEALGRHIFEWTQEVKKPEA